MTAAAPVRVSAPAKLTLSLQVLGTRPDGFHDLVALTVMLSAPSDTLTIGAAAPGVVELTVLGGDSDVPRGEQNLAVRAARALLPHDADAGVTIELNKVVPSGAGLGGGSADAAAVVRVIRDRYGIGEAEVWAAAAELGSDVPVCVLGRPVMTRGRGERLDPVELAGDLYVVVVKPPFSLSTASVFRAWGTLPEPRPHRSVAAPSAVAQLVDELTNDLEPAAELVEPRLRQFREELGRAAGVPVMLAGSGSSYWFPVEDAIAAADIAARLSTELEIETFAGYALREPVA